MSLTTRSDDVARVVLDEQGQGQVTVAGVTTHSFWACSICGIPTGGKHRRCRSHPAFGVAFLKHIREASA
jgi:hypothetical protein